MLWEGNNNILINLLSVHSSTPSEPTLIVVNVVGVMENVAVKRRKEMWAKWGIVLLPQVKEIYHKYSTEEQKIHACADIYVNCNPDSSWIHLCGRLYVEKEITASRKAKTFIPQTGKRIILMLQQHSYSAGR